jgi:hypothetical protein
MTEDDKPQELDDGELGEVNAGARPSAKSESAKKGVLLFDEADSLRDGRPSKQVGTHGTVNPHC